MSFSFSKTILLPFFQSCPHLPISSLSHHRLHHLSFLSSPNPPSDQTVATHVRSSPMAPIKSGDSLPDGNLTYFNEQDQLQQVLVHSLAAGKKVILFGVPGAFTPTCRWGGYDCGICS